MSDERRTPTSADEDDELLRSLRDLGAGYDPDLTAINRRLHTARPVAHRSIEAALRHRPALVRHSQAVLVPALAVLLVVGGIVMVVSRGADLGWNHPPLVPIAAEPPPTLNPITPKDVAKTAHSDTTTSAEPAPARTTTRTATPTGTTPGSATGAADPSDSAGPTADVTVDVMASSATRAVDLDPDRVLDWLAIGTRSDLKQVRAEIEAPLITATQPASATSTPGPFRVSWVGGKPEEDHAAAADWLKVTGPDSLTVTVSASPHSRTVVLYAGTARGRARLSIDGPGLGSHQTLIGSASSTARGAIVTVTLPPSTGAVHLKLAATAAKPTSEIYLAAVTVR